MISGPRGGRGQGLPSLCSSFSFLLRSPGETRQLKVLPNVLNSDLRVPSIIVRRHCLKTSSNGLVSRQFCERRKGRRWPFFSCLPREKTPGAGCWARSWRGCREETRLRPQGAEATGGRGGDTGGIHPLERKLRERLKGKASRNPFHGRYNIQRQRVGGTNSRPPDATGRAICVLCIKGQHDVGHGAENGGTVGRCHTCI